MTGAVSPGAPDRSGGVQYHPAMPVRTRVRFGVGKEWQR
jgi:hypothetical protein